MGFTNSQLISYTNITNNKTENRKYAITRFTPHCIVGQWTAKQGCDYFANTDRQASANYCIGKDGDIGLSVDEKDRAWTSSNADNDHRAITVEIASDTTDPYKITDKAWDALVELAVDVCKRYNKTKLVWLGDKDKTLAYTPADNEIVITVHRWFAAKACPGNYIYGRLSELADTVTGRLNSMSTKPADIVVGDTVTLTSDAVQWSGLTISSTYKAKEYTVQSIGTNGRAVLTIGNTVMYAVDIKYLVNKRIVEVEETVVEDIKFIEGHEPSTYAEEAWYKAMIKGIVDGTNPKNALTREQLTVILNRLGLLD